MIWRSTTIKETSLTLKKTNKPKTCHFPDLWGCGILFQLNISLRKIIFEKNKLVNCAHSYCIFYRMVGNLFFLMFRRLCGGRLVMAYFQNSRFLFWGGSVYLREADIVSVNLRTFMKCEKDIQPLWKLL